MSRRVFMLWLGGSGYSVGDIERDLESFPSLRAARDAFWRRLRDPSYPCVYDDTPDEGSPTAWLWFSDPRGARDPYPDRIMSFGPRGGVRVELA